MKQPAFLVTIMIARSIGSFGQPGTLDATFGNGGVALTDVAASSDVAAAVVMQPDGKVVVAGATSAGGSGSFFLIRYLTNGSPDPSFGVFGKVTTQVTTQGDGATDLVLRPDGRLTAVGFSGGSGGGLTAVQYQPDGSLDTTFGDSGIAAFPFTSTFIVKAAVQSDGRLVLGSRYDPTFDWIIIRVNVNGTLDSSYAISGSRIIDTGLLQWEYLGDVLMQSDDKAVIAGWTSGSVVDGQVAMARLTSTGAMDPTFSIDGTATINFTPGVFTMESIHSVAQLPDGRLLIVGDDVVNGSSVVRITRLFPDASIDLSYGFGGSTIDSIPGSQVHGYALGVQADDRAVIAGTTYDGSELDIALWRFNPNGSVDAIFGTNGVTTTDIGNTDVTDAMAVGIDRLVVAGHTNPFTTFDVFVAAYSSGLNVAVGPEAVRQEFRIAPNPACDHVICSWDRPTDGIGPLTIIDPMGRVVATIALPPIQRNEVMIDVSGLPQGMYHLGLAVGSGRSSQRFVVSR